MYFIPTILPQMTYGMNLNYLKSCVAQMYAALLTFSGIPTMSPLFIQDISER